MWQSVSELQKNRGEQSSEYNLTRINIRGMVYEIAEEHNYKQKYHK